MGQVDESEYEAFCRRHAARLGRVAYLLCGDRETARDIAQETLLDAYRHWRKVRAAADEAAYLRRMLVNRHLSDLRRRRVLEVLTDEAHLPGVAPGDAVVDQDAMWRALGGLSERQRAVLVLRHYEGLDDEAIAAALRCGRSTVRSLATRGLAALRQSPHLTDTDPAIPRRAR